MKFISITKSINIRPDWATIGARLKAGTPLDITGAVANTAAAVGILADDAEKSSAEVAVVTEGSIDLAEITASYGELADDCIAAIKGIAFIGSDGDPIVPSGGGLPDYSEASDGDVLSIEGGAPAWVTPSGGGGSLVVTFGGSSGRTPDKTLAEIAAAASAGQLVVFKWSVEGGVFVGIADITLSNGSMTEATASAVNGMYGGMLSTMTYSLVEGGWSVTEIYLGQ